MIVLKESRFRPGCNALPGYPMLNASLGHPCNRTPFRRVAMISMTEPSLLKQAAQTENLALARVLPA